MPSRSSPAVLGVLAAGILLGTWVLFGLERPVRRPTAALPIVAPPAALFDDIRALAAPGMQGRAEDSGGADLAAEYIHRRFRTLGLRVERLPYEIPRRRLAPGTRLVLGPESIAPGKNFAPLTWSGTGTAHGPLVSGLAARISGDTATLAGTVAIERLSPSPGSFRRLDPPLAERALAYQDLGAAGVLFVADSRDPMAGGEAAWAGQLDARAEARIRAHPAEAQEWARDRAATGAQSRAVQPSRPLRIPAAVVSWDLGRSLDDGGAQLATVSVAVEYAPLAGASVVGLLPGAFPGRAAVVVCAHFDSHGIRPDGRIYPGACDNASGVAVLLAVAQALARDPRPLLRPVVFAAFGGEELGLHGSRAFARAVHGLRGGALCAFNVDMAARGPETEITIVGSAFAPDVFGVAKGSLERAGFEVKTTIPGGYPIDFTFRHGSDHWPLHEAGIPSILVTCSSFPERDTPDDRADLCSPAKARRVAEGVLAAVWEASRRQEPFAAPIDAVVKFPGEK